MPENASDIVGRLRQEAEANGTVIAHFIYADSFGWSVEAFRMGPETDTEYDEGDIRSTPGVRERLPQSVADDVTAIAPLIIAAALTGPFGKWGRSGEIIIRPGQDFEIGMMDAEANEDFPDDPELYVETDLGSFRVDPDLILGEVETPEDQASLGI